MQFSTLFAKVWGMDWRSRLLACSDISEWRSLRTVFVTEACRVMRLPEPLAVSGLSARLPTGDARANRDALNGANYSHLPAPAYLQRDQSWLPSTSRPQLEFVVDNLVVAQLMNLETRVDNPVYEDDIGKMRNNVFIAYTSFFDYKAGYYSCHDWRPREYNALADRVCNRVLDQQRDFVCIDWKQIVDRLNHGDALQIHSDGGYDGTNGAAAAVFLCFSLEAGEWIPRVMGFVGIFIEFARSSFAAELRAADIAIERA